MPKNIYPLLIAALLGAFLLFSGWAAYRAATEVSQVTDREYYSKGLKYNSTMVEKRAASVLGWKLTTTLDNNRLQIDLTDAKGAPVSGATGSLTLFQHRDESSNTLSMNEALPGTYHARLSDQLKGEIAVRVNFEHQGARLSRQLLLSI